MTEGIIVAIISLVGTLAGSYSATRYSQKLLEYRIERLEQKLNTCTDLLERVSAMEIILSKGAA